MEKNKIPKERDLYKLSDLFKVFGDSTRIRIISTLIERELCVSEISELLAMGQSAISHQLRVLRASGLVKTRRQGKTVYYSLDDEHVRIIFDAGLTHILEDKE